ncbi:tyrosine recombinase XerC [Falseniella ignava]|uniref:Tyrosine recombinase XerC n=1 Tax=Falseniella ignava CCUG 37419 TaxID=883112 RepID=K1LZC8_9LACT|nr:tyrosine recombinase XerC [Falseniella ignava]EKB57347.1 tyrosine recombinase XerC [Falseniella ignava CCUG 37419]
MHQTIDLFIQYLINERRYSPETARAYDNDLKEFADFIEITGETSYDAITYQDIRYFIGHLSERNLSRRTIARKLSSLRAFYKYLTRMGWIESNPMNLVQYSVKENVLPDFFYEDELNQLLDAVAHSTSSQQPLQRAVLETLYATGMRVSELSNLALDQVEFDWGIIRVIGKGDKERIVPLGDIASEALQTYIHGMRQETNIQQLPNVFVSVTGKVLSPTTIRKLLDTIVEESGLNLSIHPHKLRHSLATHLLNNGADLRSVQELLGHEDLSSTQIYTHVTKDKLRQQYLNVFPRANRQTKEE